jgi:uncharacterized DUF497 family protein
MAITFDPTKRDATLAERGFNFEDAAIVFAGRTLDIEDSRQDYGETRMICFGFWAIEWSWWATLCEDRIATFSV